MRLLIIREGSKDAVACKFLDIEAVKSSPQACLAASPKSGARPRAAFFFYPPARPRSASHLGGLRTGFAAG